MARPKKYQPPKAPKEDGAIACEVIMQFDMALGNGTRERGFVIGTTEAGLDMIKPAAGVEPIEIQTIQRNPQLIVLV